MRRELRDGSVPVLADVEPDFPEGISAPRSGRARCLRPCTPHPSRRRRASRRCGNARWFGQSILSRSILGRSILGKQLLAMNAKGSGCARPSYAAKRRQVNASLAKLTFRACDGSGLGFYWAFHPSRIQRIPPQLPALRQQRHGVHEVLQRHNAYQALIFHYRDEAEVAGGELAKCGRERLFLLRHFE